MGEANAPHVREQTLSQTPFDNIINDGSHGVSDIVNTFCNYFNVLQEGSLSFVEDLHCSYWGNFDSGVFHPGSSIAKGWWTSSTPSIGE